MTEAVKSSWRAACEVPAAARGRYRTVMVLIFVWALAWMLSAFLMTRRELERPVALALAVAPTLIGIVMVVAYMRFLGALDELQRKIQTEALALGFGVGAVAMVGYSLLQRAGVTLFDYNPSDALLPMLAAYSIGVYWAARRYA